MTSRQAAHLQRALMKMAHVADLLASRASDQDRCQPLDLLVLNACNGTVAELQEVATIEKAQRAR